MPKRFAQILAGWLGFCLLLAPGRAQSSTARDERLFSVTHYDVQLEPRLDSRTVTGTVTLSVILHREDVPPASATITLNRGRLEIDGVEENGRARAFVVDGSQLRIALPRGRAKCDADAHHPLSRHALVWSRL